MPVEGQVLKGKYRLERFLGAGGFASVWAARNVDIDRPVALKILADTFARSPEFVERFVREAKLAARPIHESVIRVEDIGQTEEGAPFLVMELLEGTTLSATLRERGGLPFDEAVEIARAVLAGTAAAHRLAIIHRDLKPANVFLTAAGTVGARVRILDLGLGKDLGDEGGLTHTGQVMGTPDYMAPELLLGRQLGAASRASDVFALGVLVFEMLTGSRPLEGLVPRSSSTSGFVERAMFYERGGMLPRVRDLEPALPEAIDDLVARALAVEPSERFLDAGDMLDALETALGEMAPTRAHLLPEADAGLGTRPAPPTASGASAVSAVSAPGAGRGPSGPPETPGAARDAELDSHLRRVGLGGEDRAQAVAVGSGLAPPRERPGQAEALELASTNPLRRAAGAFLALDRQPEEGEASAWSPRVATAPTLAAEPEPPPWQLAPPPPAAGAPHGPAPSSATAAPSASAAPGRARPATRTVALVLALAVPLLVLLGVGAAALAIVVGAPRPAERPPSVVAPPELRPAPASAPLPEGGAAAGPLSTATTAGGGLVGAPAQPPDAGAGAIAGDGPAADAGPGGPEDRPRRRPSKAKRGGSPREEEGEIPFGRIGRGGRSGG